MMQPSSLRLQPSPVTCLSNSDIDGRFFP